MQCKAKTTNGKPCQAQALKGGKFCFTHDAASGAARAAARRKGGQRNRPPHNGNAEAVPVKVRTLEDVLAVLDYALQEALPLENSVQRGRLLVAICGAFVEAIKTGELESRLMAIESALQAREAQA
ncbi:MAG: hypothetical protein LC099_06570 [Anaerolineales bacterium]|nr:hypothetical protein [Anaerolineales bacterium]